MSGNVWMFSDETDDEDLEFMSHDYVTYNMACEYYRLGIKPVSLLCRLRIPYVLPPLQVQTHQRCRRQSNRKDDQRTGLFPLFRKRGREKLWREEMHQAPCKDG